MNWTNILTKFLHNGEKGKCPQCGSSELTVETMSFGRRSITFHCNKCGASRHFDGIAPANEK